MSLTSKQKYWKRVYDKAPMIECGCGCGQKLKSKDKYGRDKKFVNGHNNRKYDDPKQYKREWNHRNRQSRYDYKQELLRKFKASLLLDKGGRCLKCGLKYNGSNASVFDFHHTYPQDKEFNINLGNMNKYSKKKIIKEADKCNILCSNCHRLKHSSKY